MTQLPSDGVPATSVTKLHPTAQRLLAAQAARDRAIIELWESDVPLREIARRMGLSHVGVGKMLRRWGYDTSDVDF